MAKKSVIEDVTDKLSREKPSPQPPLRKEDALSTSSTILNLALSGMVEGGFFPKRKYLFVGDSGSGKTQLTVACLAEAARNPRFKVHRLVHDNPEQGSLMDIRDYFGDKLADRLQPWQYKAGRWVNSTTVEELSDNVKRAVKKGDPFIAVVDSLDALRAEADINIREKNMKARDAGKAEDVEKSYGTNKAKALSAALTEMNADLLDSDSIVVMISQAKVNIGHDAMFRPKTRAGGTAPKYFADGEMWTSVGGSITKTVREKDRKVGIKVNIKIEKNRQTGQEGRLVVLPILRHSGIDDVGSCVDYLVEEKHWHKAGSLIDAPEFFNKPASRDKLIRAIEEDDLEPELRQLVGSVWAEIEEEVNPHRKKRYD